MTYRADMRSKHGNNAPELQLTNTNKTMQSTHQIEFGKRKDSERASENAKENIYWHFQHHHSTLLDRRQLQPVWSHLRGGRPSASTAALCRHLFWAAHHLQPHLPGLMPSVHCLHLNWSHLRNSSSDLRTKPGGANVAAAGLLLGPHRSPTWQGVSQAGRRGSASVHLVLAQTCTGQTLLT